MTVLNRAETTSTAALAPDSLAALLPDWRIHLRAKGLALSTIKSYLKVGQTFLDFLKAQGMPTAASAITRDHIEHYLSEMRDRVVGRGRKPEPISPATVAKHYRSLQQLFVWMVEDGEIAHSPMERMHPPAVPEKPVPVLTDLELG